MWNCGTKPFTNWKWGPTWIWWGLENYSFVFYYCQSIPLTSVKRLLCICCQSIPLISVKTGPEMNILIGTPWCQTAAEFLVLGNKEIINLKLWYKTIYTKKNGANLNLMDWKNRFWGSYYCHSIPLISAQGCYVHKRISLLALLDTNLSYVVQNHLHVKIWAAS